MRMRRAGLLAVLAAMVMLVCPGVAQAAEEDGSSAERRLARMYAPVMMLVEQTEECGRGEPYVPSDVDPLFGEDSIALRGPWTDRDLIAVAPTAQQLAEGLDGYFLDMPGDPLKPGCDYEEWARGLWGPTPEPTIYSHVATEEGVVDRIALQYYFFYPFNDFNNKHEADWERIQIEFPVADAQAALTAAPDQVVYSQHYGAERADWDAAKLTLVEQTHPVVYVSAGSHASQFAEGLYLGRGAGEGFGCDTTVGPHLEVSPAVLTIPSDPAAAAAAYPWTSYRGHWGELGPQRFYEGPTGPNMKQAWLKPFTWSAKARERSFSLPGAQAASNEVSETFCTLVAGGSDVFRRLSAEPAPTLMVMLAVLLVLGWVVRRSAWHDHPLPVIQPRGFGQIVGASVKMLRTHPRPFLLIAAPAALASVCLSVISAQEPPDPSPWWTSAAWVVGVGFLAALTWAQLATAQAVMAIEAGRRVSYGSLWADTRPRVPALLGTTTLWAIVVVPLLATGLLAPVGLALVVAWLLALPVVQVERLSGRAALRRSMRLVRGQIWTVVLVLGLGVVLVSLLGGIVAALVFIASSAWFSVVSGIPQLVAALVWPMVSLLVTYAWANGIAREQSVASVR